MVRLMEREAERRELEDGFFERVLEVDGVAGLVDVRRGGVIEVMRALGRANDESSS